MKALIIVLCAALIVNLCLSTNHAIHQGVRIKKLQDSVRYWQEAYLFTYGKLAKYHDTLEMLVHDSIQEAVNTTYNHGGGIVYFPKALNEVPKLLEQKGDPTH